MTRAELFGHRLLFVVGKGGVGRTSVALALGLEASRDGRDVLLVELDGEDALGRGLAEQQLDATARSARASRRDGAARSGSPSSPGSIEHLAVEGRQALEEYLGLIIPVRRFLKAIFASRVYQYFVAAAPGLKELMAVGKIWFEVEKQRDDSPTRPRWDLVIVDAPATGHSLQFLRMPQAALDTFRGGLVGREAERVVGLLRDAVRTAVVIVATAEEMPTNETLEIHAGLRELGMNVAFLVINQFHEPVCSDAELARLEAQLQTRADDDRSALLDEVVARARDENGWARLNAANLARLTAEIPVTTARLPFVYSEELGPEHVRLLAAGLGAALEADAAVAGARRGGSDGTNPPGDAPRHKARP